jgi:HSP20 family protein
MAKKKEKKGKERKEETEPEEAAKLAIREPYWQPFDIMRSLDEEFEDFRRNIERSLWWPTWWRRPTMMGWPEAERTWTKQPLMDIKDTGKELVIEAELPGIPKENIDIKLTENSIEICGEVKSEEKEEKEGYYRQERSYSTCYRQMPLPSEVIPNKADAKLEDGVLHIKLPKKKPTTKEKAHKVNVK